MMSEPNIKHKLAVATAIEISAQVEPALEIKYRKVEYMCTQCFNVQVDIDSRVDIMRFTMCGDLKK